MDEEQSEQTYIYARYINIIIDKFEDGLIEGNRVQQFLETLGRWEGKYKKLSVSKKRMVIWLLMGLDKEGKSLRDL